MNFEIYKGKLQSKNNTLLKICKSLDEAKETVYKYIHEEPNVFYIRYFGEQIGNEMFHVYDYGSWSEFYIIKEIK